MTIRKITAEDWPQVYEMYLGHNSYHGLPKQAAFHHHNIDEWNKKWHDGYLNALLANYPNVIWFGDVVDDIIHTVVQIELWTTEEGKRVATNGQYISNKKVDLAKTFGQKYWPDSIINVSNHAVNYIEQNGIDTIYATRRGITANFDGWLPLYVLPQSKLSHYTCDLVEHIPAGEYATDPYIQRHVNKVLKSIAQSVYKLTKPVS